MNNTKKIEEKIKPIKNEVIEIKEVKPEIDINEELEKSTSLQRINLEEFTGQLSNIEFNEIQNNIEVEKKEEEKKNVVTTVVEKAFHEKANNFLLVGVLAVVLMLSVTLNGFLYINRLFTVYHSIVFPTMKFLRKYGCIFIKNAV